MNRAAATAILVLSALAATAAQAASPTPADRAFVAKVSQGGMFEVQAGKLATQKGATEDVRDFAVMEVHDHTLVGDGLKAVSSAEGVSLPARLNAEFQGRLDRLNGLSGPAFDQAYMDEMASLHDKDGAAFAKEGADGGSAGYRAFSLQTHRIVLRHIGAIHAVAPPAKVAAGFRSGFSPGRRWRRGSCCRPSRSGSGWSRRAPWWFRR